MGEKSPNHQSPSARGRKAPDRSVKPIYEAVAERGALRQGEILSDLSSYEIDLSQDSPRVREVTHTFAVIVSQDCDLAQDFTCYRNAGSEPRYKLPEVLLLEIEEAEHLKNSGGGGGRINSDRWKPIRQNKDDRYHFLERIPSDQDLQGEGVAELAMDFKRYFTVPTDELYRQLDEPNSAIRRRSRLLSPYKEHLQNRFAFHLSRVGLPEDHFSK